MRLLFFLILLGFKGFSQVNPKSTKSVKFLALPVLFKTPETGWAFGASGSANFKTTHLTDSLTRTSVITAIALFTERQQNVQALDATLYFPKEKYILYFNSSHSYFPDNFWGTGQYSKNSAVEKYAFGQFFIAAHVKKKIAKNIFLGLIADYQNVYKISFVDSGVFFNSKIFGKTKYDDFGLGLSLSYDTRNSTFWPTKGVFIQTQFTNYATQLLSTYSFIKLMSEVRCFKKTINKQVIALQIYNYSTVGNTPLRSMAAFGGANNLRGFYQGRYRDNCMYSAIIEYRIPIYKRFSTCFFGGLGDVYYKLNDINTATIKYSFGGGLRYAILTKDNLNIRLDYGYANKYNKGFYFTIGECF